LGATAQPEPQPADADATYTLVLEREGLWIAEEAATHTQNIVAELGLSWNLSQSPDPEVHAETVATEPCPISGKPGGLDSEKVAHMQPVATEPDLPGGQLGALNANARTHLASVEPEVLPIKGEDDLL